MGPARGAAPDGDVAARGHRTGHPNFAERRETDVRVCPGENGDRRAVDIHEFGAGRDRAAGVDIQELRCANGDRGCRGARHEFRAFEEGKVGARHDIDP